MPKRKRPRYPPLDPTRHRIMTIQESMTFMGLRRTAFYQTLKDYGLEPEPRGAGGCTGVRLDTLIHLREMIANDVRRGIIRRKGFSKKSTPSNYSRPSDNFPPARDADVSATRGESSDGATSCPRGDEAVPAVRQGRQAGAGDFQLESAGRERTDVVQPEHRGER